MQTGSNKNFDIHIGEWIQFENYNAKTKLETEMALSNDSGWN